MTKKELKQIISEQVNQIFSDYKKIKTSILNEAPKEMSGLKKVAQSVWEEPSLNKAKEIVSNYATRRIRDEQLSKTILNQISKINSKRELDSYITNAYLKGVGLGLNPSKPKVKPKPKKEDDDE